MPLAPTEVVSEEVIETNHRVGLGAIAFACAGAGVLVRSRALLLGVVVIVAYLAYADVFEAPAVSLAVAHRLDTDRAEPGDRVEVTVAVKNTGDETLPDLRLIDDVPAALEVVDGPARTATALRPGATMTFSYTVLARRGEHSFDGITVLARTLSGTIERRQDLATERHTFSCTPMLATTTTVPLQKLTSQFTGRVETDAAGEGVEFTSVREFRSGDSLSRVDWNRFARDRELATVEFREERKATVVLLLDLRAPAYVQAGEEELNAV